MHPSPAARCHDVQWRDSITFSSWWAQPPMCYTCVHILCIHRLQLGVTITCIPYNVTVNGQHIAVFSELPAMEVSLSWQSISVDGSSSLNWMTRASASSRLPKDAASPVRGACMGSKTGPEPKSGSLPRFLLIFTKVCVCVRGCPQKKNKSNYEKWNLVLMAKRKKANARSCNNVKMEWQGVQKRERQGGEECNRSCLVKEIVWCLLDVIHYITLTSQNSKGCLQNVPNWSTAYLNLLS